MNRYKVFIRKEERSQSSNLTIHINQVEKEHVKAKSLNNGIKNGK